MRASDASRGAIAPTICGLGGSRWHPRLPRVPRAGPARHPSPPRWIEVALAPNSDASRWSGAPPLHPGESRWRSRPVGMPRTGRQRHPSPPRQIQVALATTSGAASWSGAPP